MLNPSYARAQATYGEMLLSNGDTETALPVLNKAIKLDPNLSEAYINRAVLWEVTAMNTKNNKYYELCAADLRKVIELNADQELVDQAKDAIRKMQSKGYIP